MHFILILGFLCGVTVFSESSFAKEKTTSIQTSSKSQQSNSDLTALLLSGQYKQALAKLDQSFSQDQKVPLEKRLLFMQAYANYKSENYAKAVSLFEKVGKYPAIQDYLGLYHAISLRESGEAKKALLLLTQVQKDSPSPSFKERLKREIALTYCQTGQRKEAIEGLNELLQTTSSDIQSYHYNFERSQCLIHLGAIAEAIPSLRLLYLQYPEGDLSAVILQTLQKLGHAQSITVADHLARADQLMGNDRPQLAAQDYQYAIQNHPGVIPLEWQKKLATAYFKARIYPQAAKAWEEYRKLAGTLFNQDDELMLAQSYSRSDQFAKAIQAYQGLYQKSPENEHEEWEYRLAYLQMDQGDYTQANQQFEALLKKYPQHSRKDQIYWFLAWNYYQLKNYPKTLEYFQLLESEYPKSSYSDRVPYWRARVFEKQGLSAQAHQIYQQVTAKDPFSYYGFLSLKRMQNNLDAKIPPRGSWTADLPKLKLPDPFTLNKISTQKNSHIDRIQELLILGLWEDFLTELGQVTSREGIPESLLQIKDSITSNDPYDLLTPQETWSTRYPPAYATLVTLFSKMRHFPMALTWAIMREESRFRPRIVSPAQAIGLMQIIPPTGEEIAHQLGRKGFVAEKLYEPVVNIEFGVHYLHTNLKRFNDSLPHTIASYNGGPHNVARWMQARPGREWDEFVEEIPYRETHNYVKKVLKSYYIYQIMYF
ncbi:MAG: tetratricopeptide repeat protein [Deltaproteobacteria bacterium]|nr:tetratricopeptide repeat protein [Deltaproteobacteria bacterium]